jgi:8-oxo-dGTP pyrophosphatase MutT (NUDIX family)
MNKCSDLNIDSITKTLENLHNKAKQDPIFYPPGYKKAAVLIPFVCENGIWSLLYTLRSEKLNKHSGQVSFPGGAMDPGDNSIVQTALRESKEEIGLQSESIKIIGIMPDFVTNSDFIITPIVVNLDWPVKLTLSKNEVSKVFTIPIQWLRDRDNWEERLYTHPSGWYGSVIFYKLYDGELLWGISAKITVELVKELYR